MLKYNLSIFKGQYVSFDFYNEGNILTHTPTFRVKKMKMNKKGSVIVTFENDTRCEISFNLFNKYCLKEQPQTVDNELTYRFYINEEFINPLVGFTMYDTYGFPPELTNEILHDKLDMNGVKLCLELQKKMSEGTFKLKDNTWVKEGRKE